MCCNNKHVWYFGATALVLLSFWGTAANAGITGLYPINDTFVVDPGDNPPHAKMIGIEDCDFGGTGAREVAAATACDSSADSPNDQPHGYFRTLMRFDASELAGTTVTSTTLSLYVTRAIGKKGMDIFNPSSMSGSFDISLLVLPEELDWSQGCGSPGSLTTYITDSSLGLTHNLLETLLSDPEVSLVDVDTLYFDASLLDPAANQTWMDFEITSSVLNEVIESGENFTLLLSPADETISMRFTARNQIMTAGEPAAIWDNGPLLQIATVEVPEPSASTLLVAALLTFGICGYRRRNHLRNTRYIM